MEVEVDVGVSSPQSSSAYARYMPHVEAHDWQVEVAPVVKSHVAGAATTHATEVARISKNLDLLADAAVAIEVRSTMSQTDQRQWIGRASRTRGRRAPRKRASVNLLIHGDLRFTDGGSGGGGGTGGSGSSSDP